MSKANLKDLDLNEIMDFLAGLGVEGYRASQLCQWVFQKGVTNFNDMTNIPMELRQKLDAVCSLGGMDILSKQVSRRDGTIKYLFGLPDGVAVEGVLMRHSYGNSACVSTQAGCRMGCRFCASTIDGMVRNLTSGEMYDQVLAIQRDVGDRVSHLVLMGSGEPLDNYHQTLRFIAKVSAPYGLNISLRHITLSTCGIVPGIKRLANEGLPITLAVSLHAPNDAIRNSLMPINRKYPLSELIPACREYINLTGRRVTFEYSLIKGINDGIEQAWELAALLKNILCHVNLIPVNPVKEREYQKTDRDRVIAFQKELERHGINATVRKEMGSDIDAACGQLRRRKSDSCRSSPAMPSKVQLKR
ncbi:23S rRNA (adenine(2503)-C(2))-methyltransferase RlmN [Desulfofalx alkaliphila]|uniref:23S rRNA (adenine(2503)-C(2))-methyltransferase RlmN n=1 Tax=Desulfofalx alkaliphila TaxID=105483 RepID=UPI00068BC6CD|nr:23S rRNA (adenine(2503)-C(2))-methyltransferase RlmN [Desulfofalx alkaliphila]